VKQFLVFMCSKCRGFTNAPTGQKRRRCSYCGSIIDITKANLALFDSPEQASEAVKAFNASKGGDDFKDAVERSHDRIKALLPSEPVTADDITSKGDQPAPEGKRKRLLAILDKEARGKSCSLDRLEELTSEDGLAWSWVEKQVESLSTNGVLIFPRPWTVQLVITEEAELPTQLANKDVSSEIVELLKRKGGPIKVNELLQHFEQEGISESSVDSSLERLLRSGDIYQPTASSVSLV